MNIATIVANHFEWKNSTHHRFLTDVPSEGTLASGYIRKNQNQGTHNNYRIEEYHGLLILSGEGIYKDANHEIPIRAGDFVQRLPEVTHSTIVTNDEWAELFVVIGKSIFNDLVAINVLRKDKPVLHPGVDYEMVESFLQFHNELGTVDNLALSLTVPKIIQYLIKINYSDKINLASTSEQNILTRATEYIDQHYDQRITVEDIAIHVSMGYEKFRKLFTAHYGMSPGNYMIRHRIKQAQYILSGGEHSIKDIALQLGYVDAFTFSKQFKKVTGRTPSEFKELYLQ